jgi:hypothetical protein
MSASIENHSPEVSGLTAANAGFGLVEGAVVPASRRLASAAPWLIGAICLGALAVGARVTADQEPPAMAALPEMSAMAEPVAVATVSAPIPALGPPDELRVAPVKNPRVLPVVLRGQPARAGTGS